MRARVPRRSGRVSPRRAGARRARGGTSRVEVLDEEEQRVRVVPDRRVVHGPPLVPETTSRLWNVTYVC